MWVKFEHNRRVKRIVCYFAKPSTPLTICEYILIVMCESWKQFTNMNESHLQHVQSRNTSSALEHKDTERSSFHTQIHVSTIIKYSTTSTSQKPHVCSKTKPSDHKWVQSAVIQHLLPLCFTISSVSANDSHISDQRHAVHRAEI